MHLKMRMIFQFLMNLLLDDLVMLRKHGQTQTYAKNLIGWESKHDFKTMLRDAWNWQKKNPNGYN